MEHQLLLLIFYPISALFFFSDNHQMQLHFILRKREIFSILRCCAFAEVCFQTVNFFKVDNVGNLNYIGLWLLTKILPFYRNLNTNSLSTWRPSITNACIHATNLYTDPYASWLVGENDF